MNENKEFLIWGLIGGISLPILSWISLFLLETYEISSFVIFLLPFTLCAKLFCNNSSATCAIFLLFGGTFCSAFIGSIIGFLLVTLKGIIWKK